MTTKRIVKILGISIGSLLVVVVLIFVGTYVNNKIQLKKLFLKQVQLNEQI
ncbi:hypothetical protein I580_00530 [Enterococcus caccae ATCC BAA-1240]|uniref:Uncharacterized protein n=1 Tax=Enterococcus caccae ATCC BAA-1240 TaxID=1158612 RepID=R3TQT8_9ENTE|nr:hypothetical protein UC7_02782 [Enterococcus caccae ATCC BAA-1240]EOT68147.1 hypothetical protein I580_00530 [Enterococcus caccae ATCC BAA-1240]